MMKVGFVLVVLVSAVAIAAAVAGGGASGARPRSTVTAAAPAQPAPAPVEDPRAVYRVPVDGSPALGPSDALVTIVESLDFECPFCKQAAPTLKRIEDAYRGRVRVVFKANPLSMHAHALQATALALEARAEGGDARFWTVHDRLLALPSLDRGALEKLAAETRLDAKGVKTALDGAKYIDRIRDDQNLVNTLGATGTPTFFVNGRKAAGAQPFEALQALVDAELAKAEALVKSGVPARDVYARTIEHGATARVLVVRDAAGATVTIRPDDPVRGDARARVTVVEFSDFQCPFCQRAVAGVDDVRKAFGKDVRVVWKHMPLPFHPNATPAALAAEAARRQGKFWEMHDALFAHQQELSDATYARLAGELGLDVARFEADRRAPATLARVREDAAEAGVAGVTGTPTFVVNGEVVLGASGLRGAVERQLGKSRVAAR